MRQVREERERAERGAGEHPHGAEREAELPEAQRSPRRPPLPPARSKTWTRGSSASADEEQELYLRERDILQQSHELHSERQDIEDVGVLPSPLGEKYHRAMLRRIVKEAVEENVDEIIIADPTTQFFRNSDRARLLQAQTHARVLHGRPDGWLRRTETEGKLLTSEQEQLQPGGSSTGRRSRTSSARSTTRPGRGQRKPMRAATQPKPTCDSGGLGSFSEDGPMPGMVFKVNETMREKAAQAQRLYQRAPDYDALPRGATELLQGRTLAHLFETGGPDTWIHELGHIALHDLAGDDFDTLADHYASGKELGAWKTFRARELRP